VHYVVAQRDIAAEQHEELALEQDGRYAVALDLALDDDLRAEGKARELSRAINDLRKARDFEISDRIVVHYRADGDLARAVERHRAWIMTEALATEFAPYDGDPPADAAAVEIGGEAILLVLSRAG